jgi:hypothetical protein
MATWTKSPGLDFDFTAFVLEFLDGNHAFGLESGVHDHEVLVDADDFGRDDFTGTHFLALEAFLEQCGKALHGRSFGNSCSRH